MNKKRIVLGITGGIASYKMPNVASALTQLGYEVDVCMTKKACDFITPLTFKVVTKRDCILEDKQEYEGVHNQHIVLGNKADLYMIAPATANTIAKLAAGIADNIVTEVAIVCRCPILIAPAMNSKMLSNPVTMQNIETLRKRGYHIIDPSFGNLACGEVGGGRLKEPKELVEIAEYFLKENKDLVGKKILINAGPTYEQLDPVRYVSNRSTGKMGYALARAAVNRGAEVTLVSGPSSLDVPIYLKEFVQVENAAQMYEQVIARVQDKDAIILSAAVADYTPKSYSKEKIKKTTDDKLIEFSKTKDILEKVCQVKDEGCWVLGFAMETENVIENAIKKLKAKKVDMMIANSLNQEGAGFGTDTNIVTFIKKDTAHSFDIMSKYELAKIILDEIK